MANPFVSGVLDTFNRADEDPLSQSGAWSGPMLAGSPRPKVVSNVCAPGASDSQGYRTDLPMSMVDQEVFFDVATLGTEFDLGWRLSSPGSSDNGYYAGMTAAGTSVNTFKRTAGSWSGSLGVVNFSPSLSVGDTVGVISIGSLHTFHHLPIGTGVWYSPGNFTDSGLTAGTIGVYISGAARIDNFGGGSPWPPADSGDSSRKINVVTGARF